MIVKCLEISTRSFECIRTSIFRIGPRGMKFFNIIKIDKTLTSRTVLKVIDPKKADFWVIFFVRHHLVTLEGELRTYPNNFMKFQPLFFSQESSQTLLL